MNLLLLTDSYKLGHYNMYPIDTEKVYSYFESRNGAYFNETVFFGLQYLIKKYLEGQVVTQEKIDEADKLVSVHLGPGVFNKSGWEYILQKYNGYLPIKIKAVPEGTPVNVNNVLMTVENTDPNCYWLTNYLETLLTHVWSSSTVATLSREIKKMFLIYASTTSDNTDFVNFQLHDFGFRGVSSVESAGIEGAGHLINFLGTDTVAAIDCAMKYYNSDVCAFSVPATEHSIMTSYGQEKENIIIQHLLYNYPTGILSIVIDSYDYRKFIKKCGTKFKKQILNRDGIVVFRPDSGDPADVSYDVINLLDEYFGHTENKKGYKVLNPKVKMLWGDGINYDGIKSILSQFKAFRWSTENIVFGCGGGLLQKINRDTQRFAFKCSAQQRNGKWYDIFKKPKDLSKVSKKGRLVLIKENNKFTTQQMNDNNIDSDYLKTVFLNGHLLIDYNFQTIKENAKII